MIIWDSPDAPPADKGTVLLWNGYNESASTCSLFRMVEKSGDDLRRRYLGWIYDLGEFRFDGHSLIEHLATRDDGFSFWWMTSLAQKSTLRSPALLDVLRLMMVEELLIRDGTEEVLLVSRNKSLHRALETLCGDLGITLEVSRPSRASSTQPTRERLRCAIPDTIQAVLILLRECSRRTGLARRATVDWSTEPDSLLVHGSFHNVDQTAAEDGVFRSLYWGRFHELVADLGIPVNWLHLFMPSRSARTGREAQALLDLYNSRPPQKGAHVFHATYLTPGVVGLVAAGWARLRYIRWRLRGLDAAIRLRGPRGWLWPLVRADWRSDLSGPSTVLGLLSLELFDRALTDLPVQSVGMFFAEGRPEERAFIHAWRKHGHGKLIGVDHSTVGFWELRYHFDQRILRDEQCHRMPRADMLAVNGPAAADAHRKAGFPPDQMVEVEALRYQYLDELPRSQPSSDPDAALRVLIVGEYRLAPTLDMVGLVAAAVQSTDRSVLCVFKPHPTSQIRAEDRLDLDLTVTTRPLHHLLGDADLVVASSGSSSVVDSYLTGVPVLVFRPPDELPLIDLMDTDGITAIGNSADLERVLSSFPDVPGGSTLPREYFHLDRSLPRWTRLLSDLRDGTGPDPNDC